MASHPPNPVEVLAARAADLIPRDRATMHTPGEEVLLNKVLNEMAGLKPEAEILFVLTTKAKYNRRKGAQRRCRTSC